MFSRFGRRIFVMYEKHPVLMNCGAGSIVYAGGEVAVQVATHKELGELVALCDHDECF